ncbi:MAG: DUF6198 family protein [archaeon]|nr:DUF6198 family protein [archaeon]
MKKYDHVPRRSFLCVLSMVIRSIGMVLTIKAALGVSPLTTVPYICATAGILTLGNISLIKNVVQVGISKALYRRAMPWDEVAAQIVISFIFGYILDAVDFVMAFDAPSDLAIRFGLMIAGCVVMAFGIYMEILSSFILLPADGMNRAVEYVTHWDYGYIKILTDLLVVVAAAIISLLLFGEVIGIGIGTVVAMLWVGWIVHWMFRHFTSLSRVLMPYRIDERFDDSEMKGDVAGK